MESGFQTTRQSILTLFERLFRNQIIFFFQYFFPKKVTRPGSAGWLMAQSFRDRSNGKGKQLSTGSGRTLTVG